MTPISPGQARTDADGPWRDVRGRASRDTVDPRQFLQVENRFRAHDLAVL